MASVRISTSQVMSEELRVKQLITGVIIRCEVRILETHYTLNHLDDKLETGKVL